MNKIIPHEELKNQSFPQVVTGYEIDNNGYHYYRPFIYWGTSEEGFEFTDTILENDNTLEEAYSARPDGLYVIIWDKEEIKFAIKKLQEVLEKIENN